MGTLQHQFNTTLSNFQKFETRRLAGVYWEGQEDS
jgi:hypothetical protein